MTRSLRTFAPVAFVAALIAVLAGPQTAQAGHDSPLYIAADRYRDAVSHFEDEARRVRTIDRSVLRLIDDFEDQTGDLRSAARHPDRSDRLAREFNDVRFLQAQTEQAVFGTGCPIIAQALTPCWGDVLNSYAVLQQQISFIQPYAAARPAIGCGIGHSQTLYSPTIQTNRFPSTPFQASPFQQAPTLFRGQVPATLPQAVPRSSGFGQPHGSNLRGPAISPVNATPRPGNYRASISNRPPMPANAPMGLLLLNSLLNR